MSNAVWMRFMRKADVYPLLFDNTTYSYAYKPGALLRIGA